MNPNEILGIELRRNAKRKMFRTSPKHYNNWSMPRLVTDGNHDPKVKEARPKQHRADYDRDADYRKYQQHPRAHGKHARNAKHRANLPTFRAIPGEIVLTRGDYRFSGGRAA